MTTQELNHIIAQHKLWLDSKGEQGKRADLYKADLSGADLSGADLSGADLSDTDLTRVNFQNADLLVANLLGAKLDDTDLTGANLTGADLRWADFMNVKGITIWRSSKPIGTGKRHLTGILFEGEPVFTIGSFQGSEADLLAAIEAKHGNNEHAKDYHEAIAEAMQFFKEHQTNPQP